MEKTVEQLVMKAVNDLIVELTYYFDSYYSGVEREIGDKYENIISDILNKEK